jgi:hypothetical protein
MILHPAAQKAGRASTLYGRVDSHAWWAMHGFSHYQCHRLLHVGVVLNGGPIAAYRLHQVQ